MSLSHTTYDIYRIILHDYTRMEEEEDYNKQLDVDLNVLEENLAILVQNAMVTTKVADNFGGEKSEPKESIKIQQEHFMMEGAVENIIRSAQSLLTMTTNLKMSLITNDFQGLIQQLNERKKLIKQQDANCDHVLDEFEKDLYQTLEVLQDALFS